MGLHAAARSPGGLSVAVVPLQNFTVGIEGCSAENPGGPYRVPPRVFFTFNMLLKARLGRGVAIRRSIAFTDELSRVGLEHACQRHVEDVLNEPRPVFDVVHQPAELSVFCEVVCEDGL